MTGPGEWPWSTAAAWLRQYATEEGGELLLTWNPILVDVRRSYSGGETAEYSEDRAHLRVELYLPRRHPSGIGWTVFDGETPIGAAEEAAEWTGASLSDREGAVRGPFLASMLALAAAATLGDEGPDYGTSWLVEALASWAVTREETAPTIRARVS